MSVVQPILGDTVDGAVFDIEVVVAAVLKQVGHKGYKKLLKGKYKTFKRFLISHPDCFLMIDENTFTVVPPRPVDDSSDAVCVEGHPVDEKFKSESEGILHDALSSMNLTENVSNVNHVSDHQHPSEMPPLSSSEGATAALPAFEKEIIDTLQHSPGGRRILSENLAAIQLDTGDIFSLDWWSSADVVYCASLLFSENMMTTLSERVQRMRPGAWFITLKPLSPLTSSGEQSTEAVLVSDSFYKMSWGMARVYLYQLRSTRAAK